MTTDFRLFSQDNLKAMSAPTDPGLSRAASRLNKVQDSSFRLLDSGIRDSRTNIAVEEVRSRLDEGSSDVDTLQMMLELVVDQHDSRILAAELIERFGSLGGVVSAPVGSLCTIAGTGTQIVALLKLVQHTIFRLAHAEVKRSPVISNWDKLMEYLTIAMAYEPVEHMRALFLDSRNNLVADEIMARGTVNAVWMYPRELAKRGLTLESTAIILVHNHPSGCSDPSEQDIELTRDVQAALAPLEIVLHDHVIIGRGNWFSFRQNKLLARAR